MLDVSSVDMFGTGSCKLSDMVHPFAFNYIVRAIRCFTSNLLQRLTRFPLHTGDAVCPLGDLKWPSYVLNIRGASICYVKYEGVTLNIVWRTPDDILSHIPRCTTQHCIWKREANNEM